MSRSDGVVKTPDHLGNSSYITNLNGAITQHLEYFPFGEVFIEQNASSYATPYKYNGKELDEETGLYYYGARYYNPELSLWLSVDPLAEKYYGLSPYNYVANNPIIYVDPDGRGIETGWDVFSLATGVASFTANVASGNVLGAVVDAVGIVVDAAATVVPGVPGGAGAAIKAVRGVDKAVDIASDGIRIVDDYADDIVKHASKQGTDAHKAAKADMAKESGDGVIYKVDGQNTPSGKDYIGSADDLEKRAKTAKDGRDRTTKTEVIGGYEKGNSTSRRTAEQQGIIDNGGVKNLDNKRNEIKPSDWEKYGIDN